MTGPGSDLRHAVRLLRQQPGFTAIVLFTLALGIGATTAIFSVVNAVLLRPLPIEESERLVLVFESNAQRGWTRFSVAPANFVIWARTSKAFASMAAFGGGADASLATDGGAEQVPATIATAELFTVLRGRPLLGRTFTPEDDKPGAPPIAVIGHGLWQRRFGGRADAIGGVVTIDDRPTTIVGVMPASFTGIDADAPPDLWLPLSIDRVSPPGGGRTLNVIGRLADGVTLEQARSEMDTIAGQIAAANPALNKGFDTTLVPLQESLVGPTIARALVVLLGAVAFVLLIACVNVANLLSARGVARQREMAIRAALGASRWRLLRQLLTESVLLALLGGILGVVLAAWATAGLLALAPASVPRLSAVGIDARVLTVALTATLAAAIVFGVVPALQAIGVRPDDTLKDTARGSSSLHRRRVSHAFVIAEVGLAVVLLVGAGLLVRSFVRLSGQGTGFRADGALTFRVTVPEARYPTPESVTQFYRTLFERIRALPQVEAVGATHALPFSGMNSVRPFIREGEEALGDRSPTADYRLITPGYFAALGIPVMRGRELTDADGLGQPGAMIVNESFARRFLGGRDPIGQRLRQGGNNPGLPWLTVVGVVGDVRHGGLSAEPQPEMFWPESQAVWGTTLNRLRRQLTIVVRSSGDPAQLVPVIRPTLASIDPNRPLIDVQSMRAMVARSADVQRFSTALLGLFAIAGLVLAAAGVFGVMSYTVAAQRRDMGIRLALGARPRELLAHVLRAGLALAAVGVAVGLVLAWMLDDVVRAQLFGVAPHDGVTFVGAAVLLLATAVCACYVPARRASRVDPIEALRE